MAIRDLVFSILAKDQTARAFASVRNNLRTTEGAARSLSERMKGIGKNMQSIGLRVSALSAGILVAFRDSLQLYDIQARAEAQVRQAIESTGGAARLTADELFRMASALQDVTRFGDEDILASVTGPLLTFTNVAGPEFARAQAAILDLATALKTDLKSAALQVGKALNDPIKGISALSRAGVQFNDDQRDMIKALVEAGEVAQAQGVILAELERQFGGQAEAAAQSGLGALAQLSNAWGDLKEEVGEVLAEILPPIVAALKTMIKWFQDLPDPVKKAAVVIGALVVVLGPLIAALGFVVAGLAAISGPVLLVVAGIAALTAAVVAFWPEIKGMGDAVVDAVGVASEWLGEKLSAAWAASRKAMAGDVEGVKELLGVFGSAWSDVVGGAARAVADLATSVAARFGVDLPAVFEGLRAKVTEVMAAVAAEFTAIKETILKIVDEVARILKENLEAALDGVIAGVRRVGATFEWLYDSVVGNSWVPDMVDEIGQNFARLDGNMVAPSETMTEQVGGMFREMGQTVGDAFAQMLEDGKFSFRTLGDALLSYGNKLVSDMTSQVFDKLAGGFSSTLSGLFGLGGNLLGGAGGMAAAGASALPAFNTGADFRVGGRGGIDQNLIAFRATRGERVTVTPSGGGGGGGGAPMVSVVIQTPDPRAFAQSRGQIAAQITHAVARGQRSL